MSDLDYSRHFTVDGWMPIEVISLEGEGIGLVQPLSGSADNGIFIRNEQIEAIILSMRSAALMNTDLAS